MAYENFSHRLLNFMAFPYRAFILNPNISSSRFLCLRDERMSYVADYCKGKVLDVGCGPDNVFISQYWKGDGIGVDFFQYPGLNEKQIVSDPTKFPFKDGEFDTVTLIANINHIPQSVFKAEIKELSRILKPSGRIVVTRIGLLTSFLTHNVVRLQSMISKSYYSMDHERGMEEDERLTVSMNEIKDVFGANGLELIQRDKIWTQWFMNEVLVFVKN